MSLPHCADVAGEDTNGDELTEAEEPQYWRKSYSITYVQNDNVNKTYLNLVQLQYLFGTAKISAY